MLATLLSYDYADFESCHLCGHEHGLLAELMQPATKVLFDQNFCGIGLEHRELQSPRRRAKMKKRVQTHGVISDVAISKRGRGDLFFTYVISSLSLKLATKYYLFDYGY